MNVTVRIAGHILYLQLELSEQQRGTLAALRRETTEPHLYASYLRRLVTEHMAGCVEIVNA